MREKFTKPDQHAAHLVDQIILVSMVRGAEPPVTNHQAKAIAEFFCDEMEGNEEIFGDWYERVKKAIKKL